MQSEISGHIGMTEVHFCWICKVKGKGKNHMGDEAEFDWVVEFLSVCSPKSTKLSDLLINNIQIQQLWSKSNMLDELQCQLQTLLNGKQSKVDKMQTESGVKDKVLSSYMEQIQAGTKGSSNQMVKERMKEYHDKLPEDLFNPLLCIPGMFTIVLTNEADLVALIK